MTEETALMQAVLASPGDDLPRLVYADWLEERGDCDRSEFIRVQTELHAKPCDMFMYSCHELGEVRCSCSDFGRYDELRKREKELHTANWSLWWPKEWDAASPLYRRGFVSEIRCTLAAFIGADCLTCNDLRRDHPVITGCTLCHGTGRTPGIAAAIFRSHPVTKVTLVDREPVMSRYGWSWFGEAAHPTADPGRLPDVLWQLLPHVDYPTRQAAMDALSDACVAYGRSQ